MHAYAMDVRGARKLRKHVDVCSIDPLDIQVRRGAETSETHARLP